jgi:hypothetical protein
MKAIMVRRYFGDTIVIEVWKGVISLANPSVMRSNLGSGDRCSDGGDCLRRSDLSNKTDHDSTLMEPEDVSGFFFGGGVLIVFVLHMHIVDMGVASVVISPPDLWLVMGGSPGMIRGLWDVQIGLTAL